MVHIPKSVRYESLHAKWSAMDPTTKCGTTRSIYKYRMQQYVLHCSGQIATLPKNTIEMYRF